MENPVENKETVESTGPDDAKILELLKKRFPKELEKSREGPRKKNKASGNWEATAFTYIPNIYVSERLDEVVGLGWDWEIRDTKFVTVNKEVKEKTDMGNGRYEYLPKSTRVDQVAVLGRLTVHLPSGKSVFRDAWGGSDLDKGSQAGDAFKIADSNAFKKAAYKFGIASYLGIDGIEEAAEQTKRSGSSQGAQQFNGGGSNPFTARKVKAPSITPVTNVQNGPMHLPQQQVVEQPAAQQSQGQGFNPFRK